MSSTSRLPIDELDAALDQILTVDPIYLTTTEKQVAMVGLSRARARIEAAVMRVLAVADEVAEATGDRSTAAWLSTETRDAHGTVRRSATLATALESRWVQVADALAAGAVNLAQARVIVDALDALPKDLGDDLRVKAEAHLVEQAAAFGPRELRVLGGRVLEHLAPEIADEAEYRRLLDEERRACAATSAARFAHRSTPTRLRNCRWTGTAAVRSSHCWKTSPPAPCPGTAAPRPA
jgi:hypothetical protein